MMRGIGRRARYESDLHRPFLSHDAYRAPHGAPKRTGVPVALGAGKPLLEAGGERRVAVDLDAVVAGAASTHEHPIESLARSAQGDVGFAMGGLGYRLPIRRPQDPFALAIRAVNVEARRLALVRRALMQPAHHVDAVSKRPIDEPIGNWNRATDRGRQVMPMNDVFVQPQAAHDRD